MSRAVRQQQAAGHGPVAVIRRLGWGVVDQGVSSASNFAVSAVVARELGAVRFGAFSLAFITYTLILNGSRGLTTDPLLVRYSGTANPAWRNAVASVTGTALGVGIVAGIGSLVAGLLLPGTLGDAFLALSIGLPGLMLQDSWRFSFFAVGRGSQALLNDAVWTVLLLGGLVGLVVVHQATVVGCVLVFGATATVAGLVGMLQAQVRPALTTAVAWVKEHRALGCRYLFENLALGGSSQLRMFAVGAAAGLAAVGDIRAAEILMGPFLVILMGVSQVAVPETARVFARNPARLQRFCVALGGAQTVVALLWGAVMLVVLPWGLGQLLLGSVWHPAYDLLVPVSLGTAIACFSTGASAGLRAMAAARRSLAAQITASALLVAGGSIGAYLGGARGSAWGWTLGGFLAAVVWQAQLTRTLREHLRSDPTGPTDASHGAAGTPDAVLTPVDPTGRPAPTESSDHSHHDVGGQR